MFRKNDAILTALDARIASLLSAMEGKAEGDDEYDKLADQLTKLWKLRPEAKPLDPNQFVAAGASLIGILTILSFERFNVIGGTKAFSLLRR